VTALPTERVTTPVPAVADSGVDVGLTVAVSPLTLGTRVRTSTQPKPPHVKPFAGFKAMFGVVAPAVWPARMSIVVVAPAAGRTVKKGTVAAAPVVKVAV